MGAPNIPRLDGSISRTGAVGGGGPEISSLNPTSIAHGGGEAINLAVNGAGFTSASVVLWKGSSRTTTYVSAIQIRGLILAADLDSVGVANVTVTTPGADGGTSEAVVFEITE